MADIQIYFRGYKKRTVRKYPATIKYHVDQLLNQYDICKLDNSFNISFEEINELTGYIVEGLDGFQKYVDKVRYEISENELQSFYDDMGIIRRGIKDDIVKELKSRINFKIRINEDGILITRSK